MISPDILARIPVFRGLHEGTVEELLEIVRRVEYPAGAEIFREDSDAKDIYFLERGSVLVSIGTEAEGGGPVDIVRPGRMFGWSALVPPHVFTASARADEESHVIVIDGDELKWRMRRHPELAWSVFETLAATISGRLAGARIRLIAAGMESVAGGRR